MNFKKIFLVVLFAGAAASQALAMDSEQVVQSSGQDDEGYYSDEYTPKIFDITNKELLELLNNKTLLGKNALNLIDYWYGRPLDLLDYKEQIKIYDLPAKDPNKKFPDKFNVYLKVPQTKIMRVFEILKKQFENKSFDTNYTLHDFFKELGINAKSAHSKPNTNKQTIETHFNPTEILDAIKFIITSYFLIGNLNQRLNDGDKFIFDLPQLTIIIQATQRRMVKVSGYPDARQDLLFPNEQPKPQTPPSITSALKKFTSVFFVAALIILPLFHQAILMLVPQPLPDYDTYKAYYPNSVFEGNTSYADKTSYDICTEQDGKALCHEIVNNILIKTCIWPIVTKTPVLCKYMILSGQTEMCYEIKSDGTISLCNSNRKILPQAIPQHISESSKDVAVMECINKTIDQLTKHIQNRTSVPLDSYCPQIRDFVESNILKLFPKLSSKTISLYARGASGSDFSKFNSNADTYNGKITYGIGAIQMWFEQKALAQLLSTSLHEVGHLNQPRPFSLVELGAASFFTNSQQIMHFSEIYNLESNADMYSVLGTPLFLAKSDDCSLAVIIKSYLITMGLPLDLLYGINQRKTFSRGKVICNPHSEEKTAIAEYSFLRNAILMFGSYNDFMKISMFKYHPTGICRIARMLNLKEELDKTKKEFDKYQQTNIQ